MTDDRTLPMTEQVPMSDFERAFRDACDEAGCEYDNEALLVAIANLTSYPDIAQCPDLVAAVRGAFPHFQEGAPITPEAIKSIGKEYLEMVMGWEPQKTEIEFADDDGNIRKIVYKPGEYEAGSFPGWVLSDDASPDTSTDRADK